MSGKKLIKHYIIRTTLIASLFSVSSTSLTNLYVAQPITKSFEESGVNVEVNSVHSFESDLNVGKIIEVKESEEMTSQTEIKLSGVLIPSNLTVSELQKGLLYNLKDYADVFIIAEKETGVNAVFLSAVAALESSWGRSKAARIKNNLYGWTSDNGEYKVFNSKEECIFFVAHKLKELYLTDGGKYFNGYEVEDINKCYNGSEFWERKVNEIINQIEERIGVKK